MSLTPLNSDLDVVQSLVIPGLDSDLDIIQKLDDEPNDVGGLTAAQLKAKFDESGNTIKTYLNDTLLPALSGTVAEEEARAAAETQRQTNESARMSAESARASAEGLRVTAESARATQEGARADAEAARSAAETARGSAESTRSAQESSRVSTEAGRVGAESARCGRRAGPRRGRNSTCERVLSAEGPERERHSRGEHGGWQGQQHDRAGIHRGSREQRFRDPWNECTGRH